MPNDAVVAPSAEPCAREPEDFELTSAVDEPEFDPSDPPGALGVLRGRFVAAAEELRQAADALERGVPPAEALAKLLYGLRADFGRVAASTPRAADARDLLEIELCWARADRERRLEELRPLLERVARLRARGVSAEVVAPARDLAGNALAAETAPLPSPVEAEALDALVALADGVMDPARCQALHGTVATAFGEALAWAALRGRVETEPGRDGALADPRSPADGRWIGTPR
jgi:hypothetical protein